MNLCYLLIFIIIDMLLLLVTYRLFEKNGLIAMYVLHIILSQITINIPIKIFGFTTVIGSSLYAVLFLTIDMINEHYGKKEANKAINIGVCILIIFIIIIIGIKLIISGNEDEYSQTFNFLFSNQFRIVITDIVVSYFIFQRLNVWIFNKVKKITNNKHLWLRNNASTIISQILTAITFYEIAFVGTIKQSELWQIIAIGLVIKLVVSILETPFLYLSCKMKGRIKFGGI